MIDTVDALVKSTLAALCPNVARLLYRGKAGTFFTYQLIMSQDRDAAEDETQGTEYIYRVDIYSKRDYIALLRRTKQALKAAGFYGVVIDVMEEVIVVEFGNNKNCRIPMKKTAVVEVEKPEGAVAAETKEKK